MRRNLYNYPEFTKTKIMILQKIKFLKIDIVFQEFLNKMKKNNNIFFIKNFTSLKKGS